ERFSRGVRGVGARDLERAGERVLDLDVEPVLDRARHEPERDEEEQYRRKDRDREKREHEASPHVRPEHASAALEHELGEIAGDEEHQENEQDDVEVDEQEENDVVRERVAARELRQTGLEEREEQHRNRGAEDDETLATALQLGRRRDRPRGAGAVLLRGPKGSHGESHRRATGNRSAPEQVEENRDHRTDEQAAREREVEREVVATNQDVSRQPPE